MLREYFKNPQATAEAFDADGFFRTGDLGQLDDEGRLYYKGRIKEMVKSGGINIAPAEVEQVLMRHPSVRIAYVIGDAVFVGDTMFMPDYGTARADFPGGDARILYHSIRRLMALPPETRLFMCHDYLPKEGRKHYAWETTVAEEKARNVHAHEGVSEDDFVKMRTTRDATLSAPTLLLPSIQVNMRAGKLPPAEANGVHYLKVPITLPK